jgi:FkbM family methyltransferase
VKPFEFIKGYHSLFGVRGVCLAIKARLRRSRMEVAVAVPGIKHPVHVRLRSSDLATFRQVLVAAGYDCDVAKPPRTIIDAGANIGLTSVFYANRYPGAKIIAIEPQEANFRMLKKNTEAYPMIVAVQGALWKDNRELNIVDPGMGDWGFRTVSKPASEPASGAGQGAVRGLTVDALMRQYGMDQIDILKIDIEGSEKEVFENADAWIGKVGVIAIELHEEAKPGCTQTFMEAARDFKTAGVKGETLFMGRPGNILDRQTGPGAGKDGERIAEAGPAFKLPCKIVGVFDA